jgi:hypothetical protein
MKTIKVAVAQNKILRYVAIFSIILCGTFQGDSLFAQTGASKNKQIKGSTNKGVRFI